MEDQTNSTLIILLRRNKVMVDKQRECISIFSEFINNETVINSLLRQIFSVIMCRFDETSQGLKHI